MNISCQSIINPEKPVQGMLDLKTAGFNGILLGVSAHFPRQPDTESGQDVLCSEESHSRAICERIERSRLKEEWMVKKYAPETIVERHEELIAKCMENDIVIALISTQYPPYQEISEGCAKEYIAFMRKCAEESIRLCNKAGCGYVLIPPLTVERWENAWKENREFFLMLAETAKECGVYILLENQCRQVGGHFMRGSCAEPSQAVEWVDELNRECGEERFGFCLDTGICSLCGNDIHKFIVELGKRVKAVVLKDCTVQREAALLPFTASDAGTDWLGVIRGLRDIHFDGELVIDFSSTMKAYSPLLRPTLYRLAEETAEYLRWQVELERNIQKYETIVLFGAGNMCRNYMKNYGEKYPPLFTCDNNSKLWGTEFCGLEVKDPKTLKKVPEGCGIFICNIYYREIEKQLREMGIEGNIEYFNDEYMPTFYFERIDMVEREAEICAKELPVSGKFERG